MMEIIREHHLNRVRLLLREFPVVALLGARQVGKTTLAGQLAAAQREPVTWFDLEDPADVARLADPGLELRPLRGLVVLDEIHRLPNIFRLLRVLADRPGLPRTLPRARQRVARTPSPDIGIARGADRVSRTGRVRRDRGGRPGTALVARRLSALVSGAVGTRESPLARRIRPHAHRTRPAGTGQHDPAGHPPALLGDARALARPDLERRGVRSRVRRLAHDGPPLSGPPDIGVRGPTAPTLVREHQQATGPLAQGLHRGFRYPPRPTRTHHPNRHRLAPQGRSLLGGVHRPPDRTPAPRPRRAVLPLGHVHGRSPRPPRDGRTPSPRVPSEALRGTEAHALHTLGPRHSEPRPLGRRPRRDEALSAGPPRPRDPPPPISPPRCAPRRRRNGTTTSHRFGERNRAPTFLTATRSPGVVSFR